MATRLVTLLITTGLALGTSPASSQRMPSPGTRFEQLLQLATQACAAGESDLAARLMLLSRSRTLIRPDHTKLDGILRIVDDMATGAAQRTRQYLTVLSELADGLGSLGPVELALEQLASPLITQVEELIEERYKQTALFVLEPLWALYPAEALDLFARIDAIEDQHTPPEDNRLMGALRLSDTMSRGISGAALVTVDMGDGRQKPIAELRRKTALAMVGVSQQALDGGLPWVALDLAEISTLLFPLYPQRFEKLTAAARKQLTRSRAGTSRAVVAQLFRRGNKRLARKNWKVASDSVTYPASKGKPGLLVTRQTIEGDFRLALELRTDFKKAPQGVAFGYKTDDDSCAAIFMNYEGRSAVKIEHYMSGKPQRLHWWDGQAGNDITEKQSTWPIALELHDQTLWIQVGNSPWIRYTSKDLDFKGAIGLYSYEQAAGKPAKASQFEFQLLPESESGE